MSGFLYGEFFADFACRKFNDAVESMCRTTLNPDVVSTLDPQAPCTVSIAVGVNTGSGNRDASCMLRAPRQGYRWSRNYGGLHTDAHS